MPHQSRSFVLSSVFTRIPRPCHSCDSTKRFLPIVAVKREEGHICLRHLGERLEKAAPLLSGFLPAKKCLNRVGQVLIPVAPIDDDLVVVHSPSSSLHLPLPPYASVQKHPKILWSPRAVTAISTVPPGIVLVFFKRDGGAKAFASATTRIACRTADNASVFTRPQDNTIRCVPILVYGDGNLRMLRCALVRIDNRSTQLWSQRQVSSPVMELAGVVLFPSVKDVEQDCSIHWCTARRPLNVRLTVEP